MNNSILLSKTICLSGRDELYLVNLDLVLYMQADDHYTYIEIYVSYKLNIPTHFYDHVFHESMRLDRKVLFCIVKFVL